jgi:hypothetical protein
MAVEIDRVSIVASSGLRASEQFAVRAPSLVEACDRRSVKEAGSFSRMCMKAFASIYVQRTVFDEYLCDRQTHESTKASILAAADARRYGFRARRMIHLKRHEACCHAEACSPKSDGPFQAHP